MSFLGIRSRVHLRGMADVPDLHGSRFSHRCCVDQTRDFVQSFVSEASPLHCHQIVYRIAHPLQLFRGRSDHGPVLLSRPRHGEPPKPFSNRRRLASLVSRRNDLLLDGFDILLFVSRGAVCLVGARSARFDREAGTIIPSSGGARTVQAVPRKVPLPSRKGT